MLVDTEEIFKVVDAIASNTFVAWVTASDSILTSTLVPGTEPSLENSKVLLVVPSFRVNVSWSVTSFRLDITNSPVLRDFMVGPKLFEAIQAKEASTRNAAKLLIDFAQGKQVDPVKHYRASKVLEKAGISPSEQFGRTEYVTKADGSLKRHGATKLRFTEAYRINRKQLGEHGGSKRSVHDWVKSLINCYRD